MKHRDKIVLEKIISEINVGLSILSDKSFDAFNKDETVKRAVCMTAINVGELIKIITDDIRLKYKEIPWKQITGFRDVAAHKYEALDMKDVYDTVHDDFPVLKSNIEDILKNEVDEKNMNRSELSIE